MEVPALERKHILRFVSLLPSMISGAARNTGSIEHAVRGPVLIRHLCKLARYVNGDEGSQCMCLIWRSCSMVAVEVDLAVRAIAWLTICLYLHLERRFSLVLRIWWALFLMVCAAFVVADFVWYRGVGIKETHLWVLDLGSILCSLILCCVGWRVVGETTLREPLLNAQSPEVSNTSSIFANAGFLSLLTFSWIGPLLSVGHMRTLDLKDVPQLAHSDSVKGVYPIFQRKLEAYIENDGYGISPFKLAKALVASKWQQVASTAFLALIYTLALYVGPYSINFLVQYLNGYRKFVNEGYLLVLAFIVAKFFECFSQRHWFFRLQQVGIRVRSSLVAMIYQKGLTLSSQARQGRTIGEIINIMSVDAHRVDIFSW